MIERIKEYFAPHRVIARHLRWLSRYAGKHDFTVATGEFSQNAKVFEEFKP